MLRARTCDSIRGHEHPTRSGSRGPWTQRDRARGGGARPAFGVAPGTRAVASRAHGYRRDDLCRAAPAVRAMPAQFGLRVHRRRRRRAAQAAALRDKRPARARRDPACARPQPPWWGDDASASPRGDRYACATTRSISRRGGSRGGLRARCAASGAIAPVSRSRPLAGYYDLLGVPRNATDMEIRSAYGRDVLRLNDSPPANAPQIRATLDQALATLVDPDKRGAYDAQLTALMQEVAAGSADESDRAFKYARNGGLWFAGGGLVTAGTYAFSEGTYFLAWGPLLFGGFQLLRGLLRYLTVPAGTRRTTQLATLIALIAVGLASAGFVGLSETMGAPGATERDSWNAMIDANAKLVDQASGLVTAVFDRPGAWSDQDSSEMGQASALYGQVAHTITTTAVPARLEWYRTGLATNLHDASAITADYAKLSPSSPQTTIADLDRRWKARLEDLKRLSDRFDAQEGR